MDSILRSATSILQERPAYLLVLLAAAVGAFGGSRVAAWRSPRTLRAVDAAGSSLTETAASPPRGLSRATIRLLFLPFRFVLTSAFRMVIAILSLPFKFGIIPLVRLAIDLTTTPFMFRTRLVLKMVVGSVGLIFRILTHPIMQAILGSIIARRFVRGLTS